MLRPSNVERHRTGGPDPRVRIDGKYFQLDGARWVARGLTYGPFAPDENGQFLPSAARISADFAHVRALGANAVRLYHVPPPWLLDLALDHDLRVFIDVPWEKHRCFFEEWNAQDEARRRIRETARRLGNHPATFAISVANEFPANIVRFYGKDRFERFIGELFDVVKQEAPLCPVTFANYPSTEFLEPRGRDFVCFNVYLENRLDMRAYLRRLQHVAGALPLLLGEFGSDSVRRGDFGQARILAGQVREIGGQDLAGSFLFSYTDDWYTGGQQVQDWGFGVTRQDRAEKPAAAVLRRSWSIPAAPRRVAKARSPARWPKVSVVVCSYNGARTLPDCLASLEALAYPDYEVILVDDGSRDDTQAVARRFSSVRTIRQGNRGLSVARNVGAEAAVGEIVAYTDSDCVADPRWLVNLVRAMKQQRVAAIGGPNFPPPNDPWVAKCVAASPGGPSHVMLDDRYAEHIPGCNMGFRRDVLLGLGGFDPQFRQAGDDVDIYWRLSAAGHKIGYAPGAIVWHHRRNTVRGYLAQQKGYGNAEAMLFFKHSERFNWRGCSVWNGVIYGEGAVGLLTQPPLVYHGRFGSALFQMIYRRNHYSYLSYFVLLEWHILAAVVALLATRVPALMAVAGFMWGLTALAVGRALRETSLPRERPWWCLPLIGAMHVLQPIVRSWHRYRYRISICARGARCREATRHVKVVSASKREMYWQDTKGRGREALLPYAQEQAHARGWRGIFGQMWSTWDFMLVGDPWIDVKVWTATEDLGSGRRFTRARLIADASPLSISLMIALLIWSLVLMFTPAHGMPELITASTVLAALLHLEVRRRRSLERVVALLQDAAAAAELAPVDVGTIESGVESRAPAGSNAGGDGHENAQAMESSFQPGTV
jgi:glycosyltransferase involved in cell wall biosynthesis